MKSFYLLYYFFMSLLLLFVVQIDRFTVIFQAENSNNSLSNSWLLVSFTWVKKEKSCLLCNLFCLFRRGFVKYITFFNLLQTYIIYIIDCWKLVWLGFFGLIQPSTTQLLFNDSYKYIPPSESKQEMIRAAKSKNHIS